MKTTLIPLTGWTPFGDFRKDMGGLMEQFFGSENGGEEAVAWSPRLNLSESEAGYEVSIDLPGLKPEHVDVELRHGDLWITGKREGASEEQGKTWHRVERHFGEFRRVVRLGDDVDTEKVDAEFQDGVLHIHVPKAESARNRKIEIKA